MKRLIQVVLLVGATILGGTAHAQIADAAAQAVVGKIAQRTVKSVLDELEHRITNISAIIGTQVSLTAGNTVTSADAALRGLMASLVNEKNKTIDQIDQERALAIADVYILTDQLLQNKVPQTAAALNVMVVRDMNHLSPLLGSKTPFMVAAVSPSVLLPRSSGDYEVTVLGVGIGQKDGDDYHTVVTARFPGEADDTVLNTVNTADGIKFLVPYGKVAAVANGDVVKSFPVSIRSHVPKACGIFHLAACDYSFPFEVAIFPKTALRIDVEQQSSTAGVKPGTEKLMKVEHASAASHDKNGGPWAADEYPLQADPGYYITRVDLKECENGRVDSAHFCDFVYMEGFGPYPRSAVSIHGTNNSEAVNLYFNVYEAQQFKLPVPLPTLHYTFGPQDASFMEFDTTAELIGLHIQMPFAGKSKYVQIKPSALRADDPILCTAPTDLPGGKTRYSCQVNLNVL
jgi:hypothetical protein